MSDSQGQSEQLAANETATGMGERPSTLGQGDLCQAVVEKVHPDAVLVRLPQAAREAFVPASDLQRLDDEYLDELSPGDEVTVRVVKNTAPKQDVVVSLHKELAERDWERARQLLTSGEVIETEVTGFNRGGLTVSLGGLRGFVPNSHLAQPHSRDPATKRGLVGQTLRLVVLEVDEANRQLVLSERVAKDGDARDVLSSITPGQVLMGTVRNIVDFGAFVDLGGVDGLIHISELDWSHVVHPRDVLEVGDKVEVYVLDVDRSRGRISLSRKYLLPRPWDATTAADEGHEGHALAG
jgi:small subunit ribosomal protein S1